MARYYTTRIRQVRLSREIYPRQAKRLSKQFALCGGGDSEWRRTSACASFQSCCRFAVVSSTEYFYDPVNGSRFLCWWKDSSKFWKVLHFGYQNLLDPALDEWIVMRKFKDTAGEVTVPDDCISATCPDRDAFPPGIFCKWGTGCRNLCAVMRSQKIKSAPSAAIAVVRQNLLRAQ